MVDSIRQTGRIGIIKPPGQPRPIEERNAPRQGRRDQGRDDSGADREEPLEETGSSSGKTSGGQDEPVTENEDRPPTGHHIDVRI